MGDEVLHIYGDFANAIRSARGDRPTRNYGSGKIVSFVDNPRDFLHISDQFARLLYSAYFRANTGLPDRAPIPEALAGAKRKLVELRNVQVRWEGLENVGDVSHDGNTLHMFLINHANSFFDTAAPQAFRFRV